LESTFTDRPQDGFKVHQAFLGAGKVLRCRTQLSSITDKYIDVELRTRHASAKKKLTKTEKF
jgi:hypothetical protein